MTKRFGFRSNSRGADEIKDLPISIDFQVQKHGVVTPGKVEIVLSTQTLQSAVEIYYCNCPK